MEGRDNCLWGGQEGEKGGWVGLRSFGAPQQEKGCAFGVWSLGVGVVGGVQRAVGNLL